MKVFLTGGTGFIGQSITKNLIKRGWEVTALVRNSNSPQAQRLRKFGAILVTGDVTLPESLTDLIQGADVLIHNAGVYEYGLNKAAKKRMQLVNVNGTENVLNLAKKIKIPLTIYISSVQAFGETGTKMRDESFVRQVPCRTYYEQTKTDAHEIAKRFQQNGLPLIIVCPGGVIGLNDHSVFGYLIRLYINYVMPPVGWSPNSIFCFVEVNDLAEGIALVVEKGRTGETYLLCGDPQSLKDVADYWKKQQGAYYPRFWLPTGVAKYLFVPVGLILRMLRLPAFLSCESVKAGATNWNYSSHKATSELGWTYCTSEEMWASTLKGEIHLLANRNNQNLIQRLKPFEEV